MSRPASLSLWSRRWFVLFLQTASVLAVATLFIGIYLNAYNGIPEQTDFILFHTAIISYWQGNSLYQFFAYFLATQQIIFHSGPLVANLNPPVVSFLFFPFAFLSLRMAYYVFCFGQFILALLVLFKLLRHCFGTHPALKPAATLALASYFPVLTNMLLGQLGLILFIFLTLGWLALNQTHFRRAGIWLGLALLLKLFVGLLFVWLALTKRWAVLLWGAGVYAVGMCAALLVFGVQNHRDWLQAIHQFAAGALSWNASLEGVMERYLGVSTAVVSYFNTPLLCLGIRTIAWVFAASSLIWLARQKRFDIGLAFALPLMLLLAPVGWIYYFPILLLAATLLWRETLALSQPKYLQGSIVTALLLSGIPQMLSGSDFFRPHLWKHFDMGGYVTTINGQAQTTHFGDLYWFDLPELYTLALILFALIPLRLAYNLKSRSIHTGA